METAVSSLSVLPNSKEEVNNFSRKLEEELSMGLINPLDLKVYQKSIEKVFQNIKDVYDECVREESEKHGKMFEYKGLKIELAENGTKYDYSYCKDPVLAKLEHDFEKAQQALKDRQTFLKGIKGKINVVDEDSGDVIEIFPPLKSSKSGIKCELV
jgi:AAA15 family ATPase/GTPase